MRSFGEWKGGACTLHVSQSPISWTLNRELLEINTLFRLKYRLDFIEILPFWVKSCLHFCIWVWQPAWDTSRHASLSSVVPAESNEGVFLNGSACTFTDRRHIFFFSAVAKRCWRVRQNWEMEKVIVSYHCRNVGRVFFSSHRGLYQQLSYFLYLCANKQKVWGRTHKNTHTPENYDNCYYHI